jgi:hypothetical protein
VSSLANGDVSVTFHVPYAHSDEALVLHHLRGKLVELQVKGAE